MRHTTTAAACLLLAALTGCSTSDDQEPTVAKATTAPATPTPSPTPSPSQETYKLGDTVDITAAQEFSAAALSFKDTGIAGIPELLHTGQKWVAVEAKVCNKDAEPIGVSPFRWSLAYADGARVEATHMSGGDFPQPLYPSEAKVRGGDCVRGHILFEVPKEGAPERVLYSPADLDEPVEWQVGK